MFTAGAGSDPGIPRAVFLGLLRTNPGGLTSLLRSLFYPPLSESLAAHRALGGAKAAAHGTTFDERFGSPDPLQLGPPRAGCVTPRIAATAPVPRLKTL